MVLWVGLSLRSIELSWKEALLAIYPGVVASSLMFLTVKIMTVFVFTAHSFINMIFIIVIGVVTYGLCVLCDNSHAMKDLKSVVWRDIKSSTSRLLMMK